MHLWWILTMKSLHVLPVLLASQLHVFFVQFGVEETEIYFIKSIFWYNSEILVLSHL